MAKKQQIDDDMDLIEDEEGEEEVMEEAPPPPKKKTTKRTAPPPKTRYAPVRAESGMEDVLKLKQDNLKGIALDNMTELERRRWDQMNAPPEENSNTAILMAMAQNPQMFEGMDPNMRAMMLASMTNPQMGQMLPLLMLLKPGGVQNNQQQQSGNGMDLQQMLGLFQLFNKMATPQLPPGPSPQQQALEDQIRRLEAQIRIQNTPQKSQSDPMLLNLISQQQKNLEMLAQKIDHQTPPQNPLDAFSGMMSMFERFKGFIGAGPVSETDIKMRQLEQGYKQKELDRDFELKKRALEAQAAAAKNQGMATVIQNGINQIVDKFGAPIANMIQQTMKEKIDQSDEPAVLPVSSIDENALNKLITPPRQILPISNPAPIMNAPITNPMSTPPPIPMPIEPKPLMPGLSNLPISTPNPMMPLNPGQTHESVENTVRSGIVPMYEYKP